METVLIYSNRKVDARVWNISTPEKRKKAFLSLFRLLSSEWDAYADFELFPEDQPVEQMNPYDLAKLGDAAAAEELLTIRRDRNYEYEYWSISEVE